MNKMKTQEKLQGYLNKIKKENKNINAILELNPHALQEAKVIDAKIKSGKAGKLAGKIIAVKANINVLGLHASCGSKVLENYKSPFDATVIKKIKDEDGLIIGMANMDEFASGGSGETSAFKPTRNPVNEKLITGGSSSGSAASVAAGFCDVALGSDAGGSIRNPASHCGVVGMKPSYSSVSRYGLIDLSMSLDQIGPFAKNVGDAALMFDVMKGKDRNDSISQEYPKFDLKEVEKIPKGITIGLLDFPIQNKEIQKLIDAKVDEVSKKYGWKVKKIKIPYVELSVETYYPLVYVEFFSTTRRFDGRRYGKRIEEAVGPEVMRRILGGSEISKAEFHGRYYDLALKTKRMIEEEYSKVFKSVDCVISPTVPRLPHKIGEKISVEEMYSYDVLTAPNNLAGNCAVSIPVGEVEGIPVGMQISCDVFKEQKMFQIARAVEKVEMGKKLVLFDIDGILIESKDIGATKYLIKKHFGLEYDKGVYKQGKTYRKIIVEQLKQLGLENPEADPRFEIAMNDKNSFIEAMQGIKFDQIPGVKNLIEELIAQDHVVGLLTGNSPEAAKAKLESAGLWNYFKFGAYGTEVKVRSKLVPKAISAAKEATGIKFEKKDVFTIGDTVKDIECAKAAGVRIISVATGLEKSGLLKEKNPDFLFEDFSDTGKIMEVVNVPS